MTKNLGRNDPCWCGNGKKLKKCHGNQPLQNPQAPLTVAPSRVRTPITTHKVFDGQQWMERPGLLSAVINILPAGSIDRELLELRSSWGSGLDENDVDGLTKCLNDIEHKLRGVHYHRDNFEQVENATVERFRTAHVSPGRSCRGGA